MRRNSSAVFAGLRPLCTQILPIHGYLPSTTLGVRKLQTLGYRLVKAASVCVLVWQLTHCQGVADKQTHEFAVAYTALQSSKIKPYKKAGMHLHTTATCQVSDFLACLVIRESASGRFPFERQRPHGSFETGMPAEANPRAARSFEAWCLVGLIIISARCVRAIAMTFVRLSVSVWDGRTLWSYCAF